MFFGWIFSPNFGIFKFPSARSGTVGSKVNVSVFGMIYLVKQRIALMDRKIKGSI